MVSGPRPRRRDGCARLQWSHVFSDMVRVMYYLTNNHARKASMEPCLFRHGKTLLCFVVVTYALFASMEPCLFRHGKVWLHYSSFQTKSASMEPCLFRHGKHYTRNETTLIQAASMEPCLFRHGKGDFVNEQHVRNIQLQWSHVFSDMVSSCDSRHLPHRVVASMEPCLFRHGKYFLLTIFRGILHASMEPCLFRHGKDT